MTLNLAEELYLIALHDEKGTVLGAASIALEYGLAGALVLELVLRDRLKLKEKKLVPIGAKPLDDGILNEAFSLIRQSSKDRKPDYWVQKLPSAIKKMKQRLLDGLIEKGILRKQEGRVLWLFPVNRYPTNDAQPERSIRERIRWAVLKNAECEPRTLLLLSLIKACELINEVFDQSERKEAKRKIKQMIEQEPIGNAVNDTVVSIQAAICVSIATSSIAATTAATSG